MQRLVVRIGEDATIGCPCSRTSNDSRANFPTRSRVEALNHRAKLPRRSMVDRLTRAAGDSARGRFGTRAALLTIRVARSSCTQNVHATKNSRTPRAFVENVVNGVNENATSSSISSRRRGRFVAFVLSVSHQIQRGVCASLDRLRESRCVAI